MNTPSCPTCHADLSVVSQWRYRCPSGHETVLDGVQALNIASAFESEPGLKHTFLRGLSGPLGPDDNDPSWNLDVLSLEFGFTEHAAHLFLYSDST